LFDLIFKYTYQLDQKDPDLASFALLATNLSNFTQTSFLQKKVQQKGFDLSANVSMSYFFIIDLIETNI
jgi:hypothetical protein